MLYFSVVRNVLHSWQAEIQATLGGGWLGVRSFYGVGSQGAIKGSVLYFRQLCLASSQEALKGSVLVVSSSCAFRYIRGYLGSMGGGCSTWHFKDPGEVTLYFRRWRGIKKGGAVVSSVYFLLRRGSMVSLGRIACNSRRVLNWSCVVAFSWRNQSVKRCRVVYLKCYPKWRVLVSAKVNIWTGILFFLPAEI
jgi:hypothetical protein